MENKKLPFGTLKAEVRKILEGPDGSDEKLKAICVLLRAAIEHYDWVGFYRADEPKRELVLGPFAGKPTQHVRITFGRGICGMAAERKETMIIQDVAGETNYLSCAPDVKSEIVVPVMRDGTMVGELDIDSLQLSPFTPQDREFLEYVATLASDHL